jgi:prolyl-tRNA synthetase
MDTLNVNYGRDFEVDVMADIALPPSEAKTESDEPLLEGRGIEVGNIFQLGTHYSTKMARAVFTDQDGQSRPYYMGCYGIGVGRTLATIVEIHHDEKGILWPKSVTPYQVHLLSLGLDEKVIQQTNELYESLLKAGIEVLYDDRDLRTGEKLNDADLIGLPIRVLVSPRSLEQGGAEWKERASKESRAVPLDQLISSIQEFYGK